MNRSAECIPHPALSAILSIQPSVLNEIMENATMTGRGLIAIFLYSSPASRIGTRTFKIPPIPNEVSENYKKLIYRLMELPVRNESKTFYLSEKAADVIADHFEEHEKYLSGQGQVISDWASKYIGTVLRIAGLIHGAHTKNDDDEISENTMVRAIEIGQYFLAHTCYAYSMMGGNLNIKKAKFVLAKISKLSKKEIKRSELFQICRGKFFKKTEDIYPTINLLEEHGVIKQIIPKQTGVGRRPDVVILVNPAA